jgi:glycosyltransferase involved in cell wall biosynthesis
MPARRIIKLLKQSKPQLIYLNSLFDYNFGILPLIIALTMLRNVPVALAPRGELSAGALALKSHKKQIFIAAFRALKLHRAVTWHVSTAAEKEDLENAFGSNLSTHIATDLRTDMFRHGTNLHHNRQTNYDEQVGSIISFSRIVPKKNVATVILAMSQLKNSACLSIAGPIEDSKYWKHCLELANSMPKTVSVRYVGTIPADDVVGFLAGFDLFVLPTLGENFGHVVLESLAAGTPVIVGRDTPWHGVEASGAGWTCDPKDPGAIAELIDHFLSLNRETHERMRKAAYGFALQVLNDPDGVGANRYMFSALTLRSSRNQFQ